MAAHFYSDTASTRVVAVASQVANAVEHVFETVSAVLPKPSQSVACGQEAMRLLKKSDAELAELGLERDDVVAYAYRSL